MKSRKKENESIKPEVDPTEKRITESFFCGIPQEPKQRLEELIKEYEEKSKDKGILQEFCVQTGQLYLQDLQDEEAGE